MDNTNKTQGNGKSLFPLFFIVAICMFAALTLHMMQYGLLSPVPQWLELPVEYATISSMAIFSGFIGSYFGIDHVMTNKTQGS